eukprot:757683-Hanusia_phi.AAC.2
MPMGRRQARIVGVAVLLTAMACTLGLLLLAQNTSHKVKLLGYDPYRPVQRGRSFSRERSGGARDAYKLDDEERTQLPSWATEWAEEPENSCPPGAQCDHGRVFNPVGELGRWVIVKTSPHYNTKLDRFNSYNCDGIPGWAQEECHRIRQHEAMMKKREQDAEQEGAEAVEEEREESQ